jgi:uncharacterized protein YjbI with pentapeptide repeats
LGKPPAASAEGNKDSDGEENETGGGGEIGDWVALQAAVPLTQCVISRMQRARRAANYTMARPSVRGVGAVCRALLLLALAAGYVLALWKMPDWMHNQRDSKDRHNARLLVVSAGGAVVVAVSLLYTARSYRLSHRGQVTDRFTKALERLSSDDMDARLGGIYALAHVANDSRPHHDDVVEVLEAFIRRRAPAAHKARDRIWLHDPELPDKPDADVQAALTALGRRPRRPERRTLDLGEIHLAGARLAGLDLSNTRLVGADLKGADLIRAYLTGANLTEANLTRANLWGADLRRAGLTTAHLGGATLSEADLTLANLRLADLTGAELAAAKLRRAYMLGADLTGAYLTGATLTDAYLTGATLTRATLTRATLTRATLTGATLTRATLTGANLTRADLTGANLTGANLTGAAGVNLRHAIGLPDKPPPTPGQA